MCATGRLLWRTYMQDDVRDVLVAVHAPTLIMARPGDRLVPFEASAARAAGLPNAQLLTLPPGDHPGFDIADLMVSEILKFCEKPSAGKAQRVVTTVMFTDIVGSTEQLSVTGDEHWHHRLDVHDQVVDTMLSEYGGRRIQHTGDGVFSMFDAPPSRAVRCGLKLVSAVATQGIRIRVGIHVGECEKRGDNWSGLAIRTAPTCFASVHQQAQRSPAVDACRTSILSSVFIGGCSINRCRLRRQSARSHTAGTPSSRGRSIVFRSRGRDRGTGFSIQPDSPMLAPPVAGIPPFR